MCTVNFFKISTISTEFLIGKLGKQPSREGISQVRKEGYTHTHINIPPPHTHTSQQLVEVGYFRRSSESLSELCVSSSLLNSPLHPPLKTALELQFFYSYLKSCGFHIWNSPHF